MFIPFIISPGESKVGMMGSKRSKGPAACWRVELVDSWRVVDRQCVVDGYRSDIRGPAACRRVVDS
jgi:hypothetical protein